MTSETNALSYTPWFHKPGDAKEHMQRDVDVDVPSTGLPLYWLTDYMVSSASAENTGGEFEAGAGLDFDREDMENVKDDDIVRQHAVQSIHGERTYVPYGYKTRWDHSEAAEVENGVNVEEVHYQNINAEAGHGLKSVDGSVKEANMDSVKKLGDTLRGRARGLERFKNKGWQKGPPMGISYDVEPNMPTTDLERINDELIPTLSSFVSSGTEV